jgi:hypothetical protein
MKVIQPLFLDKLYEELEKSKGNVKKLEALIMRLERVRVFDPACGSGNFLIIAYKELRRFEMAVFKALNEASGQDVMFMSGIKLSQFYGIEIDDFAHEIALLSLWLTEHQMNVEFKEEFGYTEPTLPLRDAGNIKSGNSLRVDWEDACPHADNNGSLAVYICGNPPFLGGKSQSKEQKKDLAIVFNDLTNFKQLDYVTGWLYKATKYCMSSNARSAFVATSSICQGAQVEQLWPPIFHKGIEISFCYEPFKWSNSAKNQAGVSVSIIGLEKNNESPKFIYDLTGHRKKVKNINAYLIEGSNVIVTQALKPISNLPSIITGNSPYDSGFLSLNSTEKESLISQIPEAAKFIRKAVGANELIKNIERWCLWISDEDKEEAILIPEIKYRIENVREFRINGGDVARGISNRPHQFRYTNETRSGQIVIPIVSSESRTYIPIGYLSNKEIILSSAAAVFNAPLWLFGILTSKMHMLWVALTSGKLESRIRYLTALSYNTFPLPNVNKDSQMLIEKLAKEVLLIRQDYEIEGWTLWDLYSPQKMPQELLEVHQKLDKTVEKLYRDKPFQDASERLEFLLAHYEELIKQEKNA